MAPISSIRPTELQILFGALPDAVLITDDDGRLEYLNPAAERLTCHLQQDAEGKLLAEILPLGNDIDASPLDSPAAVCVRQRGPMGPLIARLLIGRAPSVVEVSAAPRLCPEGGSEGAILLVRDVTQARLETRRLAHRATHDALTGLVNRAEFELRLRRAVAGTAERQAEHAVGFLDLDGFKRINDTCGHLSGDELLRQLSSIISSRMRARDTVARLGGDEFGILLEHCTPVEAARIADDIRRAISGHALVCNGITHRVSVSVGLVALRGQLAPVEALRLADTACYQAKHAGGNRVQVHPMGQDTGLHKRSGSASLRTRWIVHAVDRPGADEDPSDTQNS